MEQTGKVRNRAILFILLGLFFALHCVILKKFELCVFRSICGLPCPGCGMVHAAAALFLHGDIRGSLHYHVLFIPVSVTLFFSCFPHGVWKSADRVKQCRWWYSLLFAVLLGYYLVRMIAFFPSDQYPMIYDDRNYLHIIYRLIIPERKEQV